MPTIPGFPPPHDAGGKTHERLIEAARLLSLGRWPITEAAHISGPFGRTTALSPYTSQGQFPRTITATVMAIVQVNGRIG